MKTSRKLAIALVSIFVTGFGTAASAYGELTEAQLKTINATCRAIHYGDLLPSQLDWLEDGQYQALIQSCTLVNNGTEDQAQLSADEYADLEAQVATFESRMAELEERVTPSSEETVQAAVAEPVAEPEVVAETTAEPTEATTESALEPASDVASSEEDVVAVNTEEPVAESVSESMDAASTEAVETEAVEEAAIAESEISTDVAAE
jgi:hypothetical protein